MKSLQGRKWRKHLYLFVFGLEQDSNCLEQLITVLVEHVNIHVLLGERQEKINSSPRQPLVRLELVEPTVSERKEL